MKKNKELELPSDIYLWTIKNFKKFSPLVQLSVKKDLKSISYIKKIAKRNNTQDLLKFRNAINDNINKCTKPSDLLHISCMMYYLEHAAIDISEVKELVNSNETMIKFSQEIVKERLS